jgi:voltage-gated potassium channel Kch
LRRIEAGETDGIIVARVDRFARSTMDGLEAIARITAANGRFVCLDLNLDTGTPEGMWALTMLLAFAEVTVTTVGYGDLVPQSVVGRIVAMLVMFAGIGFLAVLTATIASVFVKAERSEETTQILEVLERIEAEISDLKGRLG